MSTHNIGFYEDLTKIIFELSSIIIIYVPYFFCMLEIAGFLLHHSYRAVSDTKKSSIKQNNKMVQPEHVLSIVTLIRSKFVSPHTPNLFNTW